MICSALSGKKQIIIFAILTAVCVVSDAMLYVVLPVHWKDAGLDSVWEVGILLSLNRLARLPLNPLVGWLYSRINTRICSIVASVLALLIPLGYATASSFSEWAFLRILWGLAWSLLKLGGLFTVLEASEKGSRGYLMGLYSGTYRLGNLAGMLGGAILADMMGLRIAFYASSAVASVSLPLALFLLRGVSPGEKKKSASEAKRTYIALMTRNLLRVLFSCLMAALIIEGFFMSTVSALFFHRLGESVSILSIAFGCATLAGILQSLRWGWSPFLSPYIGRLSDSSLGRAKLFSWVCLAAALCFGLVTLPLPLFSWITALICIELCSTAMTTLSDALAADAAAASYSSVFVMTAYTFVIDLGSALGPIGGFAIISLWGMDAAYLTAALLLFLVGAAWAFRVHQNKASLT